MSKKSLRKFVKEVTTGVCDCDSSKLTAEILEGHMSWGLCHLANLAYRVYRTVHFDGNTEMFLNDDTANQLLTRPVRDKFFVPDTI